MVIKVLGGGCANCKKLMENAKKAAEELGIEAHFEEVKDIEKIMSYGVMRTPALVVDEKLIFSGRVAGVEEIKEILKKEAGK
ncbi:small redox-active disulfide protein 2 [Caldicellulosiruptor bescii]|jgi:small redox-active disulfide protein 2|uniref:Redox-active disulfide protein 2 n=2 Tax=Caldicellulosiruptor bescii TaxID=31899 RepID=B9MPS3_CALBD|nr:thioredoxin family protein [Caldicellulosiruptor bescii]ACM61706.1 redox-active disulfide protein 2 [Caldicellulosiruptor bescii DSM 6725]PBC88492.1 small redox-active disulfide protein 2 [Caldicellulosiruptor bescii]PBC92026.1 small redox-active disulfide protein 2 [Caldicellulosiruptor bescii]PBD02560.1 small redox-active disulfide protein 2 [Caldicellulosiruptor bescii]PBD05205.1 small redox-active disulfide protein 2 [Caldicellulosiruptor bescii]